MFFNPVIMTPFLGVLLIALVASMTPRPVPAFLLLSGLGLTIAAASTTGAVTILFQNFQDTFPF